MINANFFLKKKITFLFKDSENVGGAIDYGVQIVMKILFLFYIFVLHFEVPKNRRLESILPVYKSNMLAISIYIFFFYLKIYLHDR